MSTFINTQQIADAIGRTHGHILQDTRRLIQQLTIEGAHIESAYQMVARGTKQTGLILMRPDLAKRLLSQYRNVDVNIVDQLVPKPAERRSFFERVYDKMHQLLSNYITRKLSGQ